MRKRREKNLPLTRRSVPNDKRNTPIPKTKDDISKSVNICPLLMKQKSNESYNSKSNQHTNILGLFNTIGTQKHMSSSYSKKNKWS